MEISPFSPPLCDPIVLALTHPAPVPRRNPGADVDHWDVPQPPEAEHDLLPPGPVQTNDQGPHVSVDPLAIIDADITCIHSIIKYRP